MKLIENINISLSLNKGKKEIMFTSIDELLEYYKPYDGMVDAFKNCKENDVIGFVKAHSFDKENHDFIQVYKKNSNLDDFNVLFEEIRIYKGYVLEYKNEPDIRFKMLKIDGGDIEGFYKLNDLI